MKRIYIVLTFTGTWLSRAVRIYTGNEYSHVSIALDKELKYMYSFGRVNPNNPFYGSFVHEALNCGVFKKFYKTKSMIYSVEVNDRQYKNIKKNIKKFEKTKNDYSYNMIGLIGAGFNIKVKRNKKYYCSEFVKHILDISGVDLGLPDVAKPQDFIDFIGDDFLYKGRLNDYNI